jgi:hypothetical protein
MGTFIAVGDEVLTAVIMKNSAFWEITLYSLLRINRRFGGTCHFHLKGRRILQARMKQIASRAICFILVNCLAYSSTLKMGAAVMFLRNVG